MYETLVRYLQFLPSDVLPNCHLIAPESVLVVVGEAVTRISVSIDIVDIARYLHKIARYLHSHAPVDHDGYGQGEDEGAGQRTEATQQLTREGLRRSEQKNN